MNGSGTIHLASQAHGALKNVSRVVPNREALYMQLTGLPPVNGPVAEFGGFTRLNHLTQGGQLTSYRSPNLPDL